MRKTEDQKFDDDEAFPEWLRWLKEQFVKKADEDGQ